MSLSLARKTLARVAIVVAAPLLAVLMVTNPAMGQPPAQQDQYGDEGQGCIKGLFTHATGTLEKPEVTSYQYGTHSITDSQSGCQYALKSGEVNLDDHAGERVKVTGSAVEGYPVDGGPPLLNVKEVEPLEESRNGDKVTLTFNVDTSGQVPGDATFFGFYGPVGEPLAPVQLTDPNGDGTYSANVGLEKAEELRVKIEKGSGTQVDYNALAGEELTLPGEPRSVIKGPTTITLNQNTIYSATYDFSGGGKSPDNPGNGEDQYDNNGGNQSGNGDDQSDNGGDQRGLNVLPDTGGAALLPALGIGVVLIGGGLLARRLLW